MAPKKNEGIRLCVITLLLFLATTPTTVIAQDSDISLAWNWKNDSPQVPIGTRDSSITLMLKNQGKTQIRLEFVGIHMEWMQKDSYAYLDVSKRNNTLEPGQTASYTIAFNIPENIRPGSYKCQAGLVYYTYKDTTSSKVEIAHPAPRDFEVIPVKVVTVISTTTVSDTQDWAVDFALLIAFTSVGLALLATFRSSRKKQTEE